jgi:cytochrome bd-type quinol oxidase subunit 2
MELDNFRRRWQEQPVEPTQSSLTEQKLRTMLANQTDGPVAHMKRNAIRDLRFLLVVLVINVANVFNLTKRHGLAEVRPVLLALVVVMVAFVAWNMFTQLRLIRQLQEGAGAVYLQLRTKMQRIRQLMHLRRYAGGVFLVALAAIVLFSQRSKLAHTLATGAVDWKMVSLIVLIIAALGVLVLIGEHKQQRRYGQYLDQLEATLRELEA